MSRNGPVATGPGLCTTHARMPTGYVGLACILTCMAYRHVTTTPGEPRRDAA